jgi:esterase
MMRASESQPIEMQSELEHLRAIASLAGVAVRRFVLPTSHDVVLGHIRLHYLDWGGTAGRSIVFLHGGGLTAHTWDIICLSLRERFHCYALDLRGHGNSEWSPNLRYGIDEHAVDIQRFIDWLQLGNVILVGQSLGGLVAIPYAANHSGKLALLVLVDVGPTRQAAGAQRIAQFMSESVEGQTVDEFVQQAMEFNPRRNPELLRTSLHHNLHQLPDGTWTWKYDRRHRARWPSAPAERRLQLWSDVERIECATVILRGAQSDIFGRDDAEQLCRSLANGTWVEVEDAGHSIQGDNPAGFLKALEPFLRATR